MQLRMAIANGLYEQADDLTSALIGLQESALPAIEEGLAKGDALLSGHLLRVLGGIPGDASTSLLVTAIVSNPSAVGRLGNREVRRPLSPQEFGALEARINSGRVLGAGSAARVLAKCVQVPASVRVGTILPRFVQEVVSPTPVGSVRYSYLSPRVLSLNQFLLAFSYIGDPAIAPLSENRGNSGDPELRKWLALALGMAGDDRVAGELKQVVLEDPDKYVRAAAVRAYAKAAGEEAIPLLVALLQDTTESEYRGCVGGPPLVIRLAARSALSGLGRADLWMSAP